MGFRSPVRRSTLADANELRDWRIYAELAQRLMLQARKLYAQESLGMDLNAAAYALDSTTIELCLSLFPWAHFRPTDSAIKMHTLLDLRGSIPAFIRITTAMKDDASFLDQIVYQPGAYYIMDRGYLDFDRFYHLHLAGAFFVTRAKRNLGARRLYSHLADRSSGIMADQTVALNLYRSHWDYPAHLRRIRYRDPETGNNLVFLTNQFTLPAATICALYKSRWQVELFFKWIKQHLRIKVFFGTSENAVKTQLWMAISVYLLVAIVKKRLNLPGSLYSFPTGSVRHSVRENAHHTGSSTQRLHKPGPPPIQPTDSVRLLTGQQWPSALKQRRAEDGAPNFMLHVVRSFGFVLSRVPPPRRTRDLGAPSSVAH